MKLIRIGSMTIAFVAALICGSAVAGSAPAIDAFVAAAKEKYAVKREAFKTGNAELLKAEFYADEAVIVGDGYSIVGIDAIFAGYKRLLPSRKDIEITILRSDVSRDGALAYQLTHVQPTAADPNEKLPSQTVLFVWKKGSKGWRVDVEMSVKGVLTIPPL